jgi:hypothetical protein
VTLAVINPFASPMEQAAQEYARRGLAVFPLTWVREGKCSCNKDKCGNIGKHPLTMHGFKDATTDPKKITKWWTDWPSANIGIACGVSRLVVVDVDPRNDGDSIGIPELQRQHGSLPATLTSLTGGGGWHYVYKVPVGHILPRCWVPPDPCSGVEIKADGGYIVAPPSLHELGAYRWDVGQPDNPEDAPEWLLKSPKKKFLLSGGTPRTGIIGAAFVAAGMMGRSIGADKATVICPWESDHSIGEAHNSSTVVFGPAPGSNWGNFHCSHASCTKRFEGMSREAKRKFILDALPKEATDAARASVTGADREIQHVLRAPWEDSLNYNNAGTALKADPGNLALLLANTPEWAQVFTYDEARDKLYWKMAPPEITGLRAPQANDPINDYDYIYIGQWFAQKRRVSFKKDHIQDAVLQRGNANRHNSLTTHLDSLVWDGVPRLERWLSIFLGVEDTVYTRFVGKSWLISAMARAYAPGCKADHVLVLEGRQGVGKTSTFEILGGSWHLPDVPRIDNKDARGLLAAAWIAEFSELAAFRGVEFQKVKSFITERIDKYRPPYWRASVERPRRCVFAGSTNEKDWVQDTTGARRFWPVHVTRVLFDELNRYRDALLAEAREAYRAGEQWHPQYEGEIEKIVKEQQSARIEEHPWEPLIASYIRAKLMIHPEYEPSTSELFGTVGVPPERQDLQNARHLGRIMRQLGWGRRRGRVNGELTYVWTREEEI